MVSPNNQQKFSKRIIYIYIFGGDAIVAEIIKGGHEHGVEKEGGKEKNRGKVQRSCLHGYCLGNYRLDRIHIVRIIITLVVSKLEFRYL